MPLYFNYTLANAVAFNLTAFACIAFVVFLSSTQPFYLAEVLDFKHRDDIGYVIGLLGFVDELTSIVAAPLVGALSDRILIKSACGSRIVVLAAFVLIGCSLGGYGGAVGAVFPDLVAFRMLFALGVVLCMSMVTVMFTEISNLDFDIASLRRGRHADDETALLEPVVPLAADGSRSMGKYAAMMGVATGLGAIFLVTFLLTLPTSIQLHSGLTIAQCIRLAYGVLGVAAVACGGVLYFFLYSKEVPSSPPALRTNYLELLYHGLAVSQHDARIQLAYMGALVSRLTTVLTSIFIPLLVYTFYADAGKCAAGSRDACYDGYVFAAILTGVAQTVALVVLPVWGFLIDSAVGKYWCLMMSAAFGLVGTVGLCLHDHWRGGDTVYDPRNAVCFVMILLVGVSQMGIIMSSMSLLGGVVKDTRDLISIGSISGVYSLFGGVGILLLTLIGGEWSDRWILGPFMLLGVFNAVLLAGASTFWRQ